MGKENIPTSGAFIVIAPHDSFFDPWIIGSLLRLGLYRPVHWVSTIVLFDKHTAALRLFKKQTRFSLFCGTTVSFFVKKSLAIPIVRDIDRQYGDFDAGEINKAADEQVAHLLQNDGVVGIFPEGGRGREGESHAGFVIYSKRYNVPVLPVRIKNGELVIGELITSESMRGEKSRNLAATFTAKLRSM